MPNGGKQLYILFAHSRMEYFKSITDIHEVIYLRKRVTCVYNSIFCGFYILYSCPGTKQEIHHPKSQEVYLQIVWKMKLIRHLL